MKGDSASRLRVRGLMGWAETLGQLISSGGSDRLRHGTRSVPTTLGQHATRHLTRSFRKPEVAAAIVVGEALVIKA